MVLVYYRENIQVKSSQGMKHIGQRQGSAEYGASTVLSLWSQTVSRPWHQCVTIHTKYCQPGKLIQAIMVRGFIGAPLHWHD